MAEFVSNLDFEQATTSHDAALYQGRAPDGGVYCFNPNKPGGQYPQITREELRGLIGADYIDIAKLVISKLVDGDVPLDELDRVAELAYADENFPLAPEGKVVTVTPLYDGIYKGNLSNGRSLSFKDIGMAHLAHNTHRVVQSMGSKLLIATTSTGDTWPSAETFFGHLPDIEVVGFSPDGKGASSPIQNAQMAAYADSNIHNVKVPADFDTISRFLEEIKQTPGFEDLGTVNSVNIARLIPQVAFHLGLILETVGDNIDQQVDLVIPSGNFGDAFAAYILKRMGAPIDKIVLGNTEANNALYNLVEFGRYDRRESSVTMASAMDIMAPANLPRLIFDMLDGDVELMREFNDRHQNRGGVKLTDVGLSPTTMKEWGFESDVVWEEDISKTIRTTHHELDIFVDPHTAVALAIAKRRAGKTNNPQIVLSTAHETKFEELLVSITGRKPPRPDHMRDIEERAANNPYKTQVIRPHLNSMMHVIAMLQKR